MKDKRSAVLDALRHGLVVSCQPVPDGPTDSVQFVVGFAQAAVDAGAAALRIESIHYTKAVRAALPVPIIGIVKRDLNDSPVRITPFITDVEALADAGADIIAFDATHRPRPAKIADIIACIHARGLIAMADCASLDDARNALALGADMVGTTLSGYTGGPVPEEPDIALISAMAELTPFVIAEGRLKTPADAHAAAEAGAYAVVVGSAITRTEYVTGWFRDAVQSAYADRDARPRLAIDIGGTKIMAAQLVSGRVIREITIPTARDKGPVEWLEAVHHETRNWEQATGPVGIAATGMVRGGRWSALNPGTLAIPDSFPLEDEATRIFSRPARVFNDAQAAAWGEYRYGAGRSGGDMAFLTVSTGVGGGLVMGARLLGGLAGHFGQTGRAFGDTIFEETASGRWIEQRAREMGHAVDARGVFEAHSKGAGWASDIIDASASRVAGLCCDIKCVLDVERVVIGGGIGLAAGYLECVRSKLALMPPNLQPTVVPALLGPQAGVIGAAALAAA